MSPYFLQRLLYKDACNWRWNRGFNSYNFSLWRSTFCNRELYVTEIPQKEWKRVFSLSLYLQKSRYFHGFIQNFHQLFLYRTISSIFRTVEEVNQLLERESKLSAILNTCSVCTELFTKWTKAFCHERQSLECL